MHYIYSCFADWFMCIQITMVIALVLMYICFVDVVLLDCDAVWTWVHMVSQPRRTLTSSLPWEPYISYICFAFLDRLALEQHLKILCVNKINFLTLIMIWWWWWWWCCYYSFCYCCCCFSVGTEIGCSRCSSRNHRSFRTCSRHWRG
jgi:hypothetical protein